LTEDYEGIVFLQLGSWHSDPCEQCHVLRLHRILFIQGKCTEYFENL